MAQLNPTLCALCKNLSVMKLSARREVRDDNGEVNEEYGCSHHESFAALEDSAKTCALCKLFVQTIGLDSGSFIGGLVEAAQITEDELRSSDTTVRLLGLEFPYDQNVPPGLSHLSVGHTRRSEVLALYSEEDDPAAKCGDVAGRKVEEDAGSHEGLNLVKRWLRGCLENHRECSGSSMEERALPTRVIDVRVDGEVEAPCLVETNGVVGQYVTLSHRWAKPSEMVKLETANLEVFKKGLVLGDLPKVFQDAIYITRKLGLRYIWIDSICIIQDSLEDWEREAAKMSLVYSNSILTIAATGANDSSQGCFLPRKPPAVEPVVLEYPLHGTMEIGKLFIAPRLATFDESISRAPLNRRGWVLQEFILSRRIVHYARDQMYWECQSISKAEDGASFVAYSRFKQLLSLHDRPDFSHTRLMHKRWYALVQDYKDRLLTKDTDMLPALAGLASEFGKLIQQKYLAGLWNVELTDGLMWQAKDSYLTPPSTYRAPSWSWAALDGPITYQLAGPEKRIPAVDIESTTIATKAANSFGSVQAGVLNLSGWIREAEHSRSPVDHSKTIMHRRTFGEGEPSYPTRATPQLLRGLHTLHNNTGEVIGWTTFDEEGTAAEQEKCTYMLVSENHYTRRTNTYNILALRSTGRKPNEHKRLGMGEIGYLYWFDEGRRETISII